MMTTNKEVLAVSATKDCVDWLISIDAEVYARKATIAPGFYLVDSPYDNVEWVSQRRDAILRDCLRKVFVCIVSALIYLTL